MAFSDVQVKSLSAKLSDKHIRTRTQGNTTLSYVEGWHAIAEANRIFGFDGWSRETLTTKCVWSGLHGSMVACCYMAHVRILVTAGDKIVKREGTGSGSGVSQNPSDAHEFAMKSAETDAMKRAFATFGNPFGLALYDKEQTGVRHTKSQKTKEWIILDEMGETLKLNNTPLQYCSEFRQAMENIDKHPALMAFWKLNLNTIVELRQLHPNLKTEKGYHYGDVLSELYTQRLVEFASIQKPDRNNNLKEQDLIEPNAKAVTAHEKELHDSQVSTSHSNMLCKGPIRSRDKTHLKYVASQACLICERTPSQAHHLKHAQLRAMGRKPGDQWTVPLCAIHHRKLHDHGNEVAWWMENKIDPITIAENLWHEN